MDGEPDLTDPEASPLARIARKLKAIAANPTEKPAELEADDSASAQRPQPEVLGDFVLEARLDRNRGGMGQVYAARQRSLAGRRVAVKVLPTYFGIDPRRVARFQTEAVAAARIRHPHIIGILQVGEERGTHFIAQELVESGRTLVELLEEARAGREAPSAYYRRIAEVVAKVASALQAAHEAGVVHRDIKPSNILVTSDGEPKVADFGLAKDLQAVGVSRTGESPGTPSYMSPEQVDPRLGPVDGRSDVFSLGATMYEALTFVRAFDGDTHQEIYEKIRDKEVEDPRRIRAGVPPELALICRKALEKERLLRYGSMRELEADLRRYLTDQPIRARTPSYLRKVRLWTRRNPARATVAVGSVVLLGLAVELARKSAVQAAEKARLESEANKITTFQERMFEGIDASKMGEGLIATLPAAADEAWKRRGEEEDVRSAKLTALRDLLEGVEGTDLAVRNLATFVLEPAQTTILDDFADQPRLQAKLLLRIGSVLRTWGLADRAWLPASFALGILEQHLGAEHVETLGAYSNLGSLLFEAGMRTEAEACLNETLGRCEKYLPPNDRVTLNVIGDLGSIYQSTERLECARAYLHAALEGCRSALGNQDMLTQTVLSNLGMIEDRFGRVDLGADLVCESLEICIQLTGRENLDSLQSLSNTAMLYDKLGKKELAEEWYREGVNIARRRFGRTHVVTRQILQNLALQVASQKKYAEAVPLLAEAIELSDRYPLEGVAGTIILRLKLILSMIETPRKAEAEAVFATAEQDFDPKKTGGLTRNCYDGLYLVALELEKRFPGRGYAQRAEVWQARKQEGR